jgi:hypothetical protein
LKQPGGCPNQITTESPDDEEAEFVTGAVLAVDGGRDM